MFNKLTKAIVLTFCFIASSQAFAFDFFRDTYLLNIKQGSELSGKVSAFRNESFETAAGGEVRFDKWYNTKWTDAQLDFMTKVDDNFGIIWGVSTGERGAKYKIDPSLKLGFVYMTEVRKNVSVSFKAHYRFGGRLREQSCVADYGDIGGVQQVNCRLAASVLSPQETLKYLLNEKPEDAIMVSFQVKITF